MKQTYANTTNSFQVFLKQELSERCRKNPAYSLRSFAKKIGISHSALSQILSGKRTITTKTRVKISEALELSPDQIIQYQIRDISFEEHFDQLNIDHFEIQSDTIHDAILELTHLCCFQPKPTWIAKVLEVNVHQVHAAVDRLVRTKLLKIEKSGKWKDQSHYNTNNHIGDLNSPALRHYQKQVLEKSLKALEEIPRGQRDHTTLMLKYSEENIQEAKALIKDFRTKFSVKAKDKSKSAHDVYVLNISFFPISKTKGVL